MKCGPDQKTIETFKNITFLENSLHFVVVLEQVLMQSKHTALGVFITHSTQTVFLRCFKK